VQVRPLTDNNNETKNKQMENLKERALDEMKDYVSEVIDCWPELEEDVYWTLLAMLMDMDDGVERDEAINKCLFDISELTQR
tara:strand:+ start:593 stop:838 length:246 start_codon:yes stop_codon:yes gene_type:complete